MADPNDQGLNLESLEGAASSDEGGERVTVETQVEDTPSTEQPAAKQTETQETPPADTGKPKEGEQEVEDPNEPKTNYYQRIKNERNEAAKKLNELSSQWSDPNVLAKRLTELTGQNITPQQVVQMENQDENFDDLKAELAKTANEDGTFDIEKIATVILKEARKIASDAGRNASSEVQQQVAQVEKRQQDTLNEARGLIAKYPELDQTKAEYDEELANIIFDQFGEQGGYEGKVTFTKVAQPYLDIAKRAREGATKEANRVVKIKTGAGIAKGGNQNQTETPDDSEPEDWLAAQMMKGRK